jgi:two-component sensor histidine kinase
VQPGPNISFRPELVRCQGQQAPGCWVRSEFSIGGNERLLTGNRVTSMEQRALSEDAERLDAVRRYDILDTPPDGAFDRVTRLAARHFKVPIAIVSIVDHDRIWFKSHHGVDAREIPRSPGLCASAILDNKPWVVTDAKVDVRALANPLVAGDFGLRFYAGVPLHAHDGFNLGTLCIIDHAPRQISEVEIAELSDFAAIVMGELELRLAAKRSIEEKDLLFREVHHRVRNNLQVVASLLAVQSRSAPSDVRLYLDESLRRVHAMGLLHEKFYKGRQVETIDLATYVGELLVSIIGSFGLADRLTTRVEGAPIRIGLDIGTPLAMLLAEVISNACQHGFPGGRKGEVAITVAERDGAVHLQVSDNGVGLGTNSEPPGPRSGMGHRLIAKFVEQLSGTARYLEGQGTFFELSFPRARAKKEDLQTACPTIDRFVGVLTSNQDGA